jgi:hypothetical protein
MGFIGAFGWFIWAGACAAALYFFQKEETKEYIKNYHDKD